MLYRWAAPVTALLVTALSACSSSSAEDDGTQSDSIAAPSIGACRVLEPEDIAAPTNDSAEVDCTEEHTAETFMVGSFPTALTLKYDLDSPELGGYIYKTCSRAFQTYLGGDESTVMRSILTWAWFRPSDAAWEKGASWYRCDVVAGNENSEELLPLPPSTKGLLLGRPDDRWMTCVDGDTVAGSEKIPCSEPHTWRAVTTIKLGDEDDGYPGDTVVEARTRDFCSDSVGAWLNYPVDFDYGYTYFHQAEWKVGNRRSICWAKTDQ